MARMTTVAAVLAVLAALAAPAAADNAKAPAYGPFEGAGYLSTQGYQELKLSTDRWYVAYQGNRETSPDWVEAAWAARSAQLCMASGAAHFVALRYGFEAVALQDEDLAMNPGEESAWAMRATAGPVYVPIFTPSAPQVIVPVTGPSKLAAMRCVKDPALLKTPERAVAVQAALDKARQMGMTIPR